MLKTEQVLNKLPDQGISHPQGRGHWIYLAIIDHFATFAQAFATANKSGKTAAAKLCRDFALRCKFSQKISHDLGWGNLKPGSCTPQCWARDGQGSPPPNAEARAEEQLVNRTCGPCARPAGLSIMPLAAWGDQSSHCSKSTKPSNS